MADAGLALVSFGKHERKDDITREYLQRFDADEGVLYVGRAQEKARVVRTERRRSQEALELHIASPGRWQHLRLEPSCRYAPAWPTEGRNARHR